MSETPVFFAHSEFANGLWVWALVLLAFILLERRGSDALDRLVGPTLQNRLIDRPSPWRRWTRIGLLGMAVVLVAASGAMLADSQISIAAIVLFPALFFVATALLNVYGTAYTVTTERIIRRNNETTRWAHVDQRRAIPQTALRAADN